MRWLAAMAILAAGTASAEPAPAVVTKAAEEARAALDSRLLDYPSARFRGVTAHVAGKAVTFCGQVNAKNRSGGYVGWEAFGVFVADGASVSIDPKMTAILCAPPTGEAVPGDFSAALAHR